MSRRFHGWSPVLLTAIAVTATSIAVVAGVEAGAGFADLRHLVIVVAAAAVGSMVARAQPHNPVGWWLLAAGAGLALADAGAWLARAGVSGGQWLAWLSAWNRAAWVIVLMVMVPLHFPDGLPPGRRWRVARRAMIIVLAVSAAAAAVRPGPIQLAEVDNPLGVSSLTPISTVVEKLELPVVLVALAAALASLVERYRRASRIQRRQIKWLAYAVAVWLVLVLLSFPVQGLQPQLFDLVEVGLLVAAAGVPGAVGIAILRHGLYDIDLVISRTLVYAALTAAVVTLYIVIVGYLGLVLQTSSSLAVSLVATGVVAVAFNPLRVRLQRAVNRLVYGDRDDPYAALSRLGRRLDEAATPRALLDLAASEVADALRLSYVAVEVDTPTGTRVAVANRVLRRLGDAAHTDVRAEFPMLTEREREVLELVAAHLTNPEIATRLRLSDKTVRNHVSNIFTKLGVSTRTEAVTRARQAGMGARER